MHSLVCPVHASHEFICIPVSHFWLYVFSILFSVFTIFAVWRFEVSYKSHLSRHNCKAHLCKCIFSPRFCRVSSISFFLSHGETFVIHRVNIRW